MQMEAVIAGLDWANIGAELDQEGYAVIPGLLDERQVTDLAALAGSASVDHGSSLLPDATGHGDLFSCQQGLPAWVDDLRASFYVHLAPIANRWNEAMGVSQHDPLTPELLAASNGRAGQVRSRVLLSRLREGDYQALHQRSDDGSVFPLQLVALLSEPGMDFSGGEFVMTEQRPRMQSRPMVLPLRRGDVAVIAVALRPHRGSKGYYKVNLKHAISRVRSGERVGLEILLCEAAAMCDIECSSSMTRLRSPQVIDLAQSARPSDTQAPKP